MRKAAIAVMGFVLLLTLPACAENACPAIGWNNVVTVDAAAYGDDVFIQLCTDAGCSAAPGEEPTPSSDPATPVRADDTTFGFGMAAPDEALVRVYAADGSLVAESEHTISWTHSTDRCGGPSTAEPIVLQP
ncbi:hypothetical protein [Microbacterium sp.]|uniref:hypothetical protein n=1 Tax=Microbacterium sp. TaxID=51671 RepID=UPI002811527A|nr:hypothetical protein [Microbacterium sp.]